MISYRDLSFLVFHVLFKLWSV